MTLVAELELPAFDYTDPSMRGERFHAAMAQLRGGGWLAQAPHGYMTLDREAGEFFLRTRSAIFPGMKIAEIFGVGEGPLYEQMKHNILQVNGADHSRLRSLVNPTLSPRAVERFSPAMRGFLEGLLEQVVADAQPARSGEGGARRAGVVGCEFVEAFAKPYPSQVIAEVMGAPLEDAPRLHHWSNWIQRQFDAMSMAGERKQIERAVEEFYEYAQELVRARRKSPADDLISKLIAAEEQGDRLSDVECINLVLSFRDVTFPEGTVVMVCAFTGNRDLDEDAAGRGGAESFDITSDRGRARALTFGAGVHYCLGANLARAELQEGLAFLAQRVVGLELDGEPIFESVSGIYGLAALPVRLALRS